MNISFQSLLGQKVRVTDTVQNVVHVGVITGSDVFVHPANGVQYTRYYGTYETPNSKGDKRFWFLQAEGVVVEILKPKLVDKGSYYGLS